MLDVRWLVLICVTLYSSSTGLHLVAGDMLSVMVVGCSRLRSSGFPADGRLFATISLDPVPWTQLLTPIDIEIHKNNLPRFGVTFKYVVIYNIFNIKYKIVQSLEKRKSGVYLVAYLPFC